MQREEFNEFIETWAVAHEIMAGGRQFSNMAMKAMFNLLAPYPLEIIKQAVNKHMAIAQFAPQVSDIIKLLNVGNTRPSADEMWAEIPKDNDSCAVVSEESMAAWCLVSDLYKTDRIGARMGFKAAYERITQENVVQNKPIKWFFSHGTDKHLYQTVTDRAVSQGRLSPQSAQNIMLSAPKPATSGIVGLLTGKIDGDIGKKNAARARELISFLDAEMEKDKKAADEKLKSMQDKRNFVIDAAFNKLAESLSPKELKAVLDAHLSSFEIPTGLVDA